VPSTADVAARWYLDENVSEQLVILLVLLGHDAIGTTMAGNKGIDDAAQLFFALRSERVLLTHNARDFELIHRTLLLWSDYWDLPNARRHAGILLFPDSGQLATADAAHEINRIATEIADFSNLFFSWHPRTGWNQVT
jgi:hypothetical protein